MKKILLKNIEIVDPTSEWNRKTVDTYAENGLITRIENSAGSGNLPLDWKIVDLNGCFACPGLMDIAAWNGEPGYEDRETLQTLSEAAEAGGFTDIAILPNSRPVSDKRSAIEYLLSKSSGLACRMHPIGSISENCDGKELAELRDMHEGGAIAFSDGYNALQEGALLYRALLYGKAFGAKILHHPSDQKIFTKGMMHEGLVSTRLGSRGIPVSAEVLAIQRDLELVRYTGAELHLLGISSGRAVEIIRDAKKEGLPITCSVPVWNIAYTDENIGDFDINFKFDPPLRSELDRIQLIEGLKDGTIDAIYSHHLPWNREQKDLEFHYSKAGSISLQTSFALSYAALENKLSLEDLVRLWSINPRSLLGAPNVSISEGSSLAITIFQLDTPHVFAEANNKSISLNSPLFGQSFALTVKGTVFSNHISFI